MTRPDAFRVGHAGVVRLTAIVIAALIAGGTSILLLAPSSTATTCVPVSICNYDDATERVQLALESGASIDERGAMSAPPSGEITGQGGSPRTSTLSIHARFATNSALGESGAVSPSRIRFSQDSVSATFRDGSSMDDLVSGLRSGAVDPASVPPIRVFEQGGEWFTLDNRRLLAFQEAGVDIPFVQATPAEIAAEAGRKMTTTNGGTSIRVRGR